MPDLMTTEELAIIDSMLSLPHRTQEDWAAIKAFLTDRNVIVMESEAFPSAGHMTISDGALLAFTTMDKCTDWIDRFAPKVRFIIGSMPYTQAVDVSDEQRKLLYLDVRYDGPFICYQNQQLAARMLVKPETVKRSGRPGPNDPCPCGSGKKYKKCCGRG